MFWVFNGRKWNTEEGKAPWMNMLGFCSPLDQSPVCYYPYRVMYWVSKFFENWQSNNVTLSHKISLLLNWALKIIIKKIGPDSCPATMCFVLNFWSLLQNMLLFCTNSSFISMTIKLLMYLINEVLTLAWIGSAKFSIKCIVGTLKSSW